ncbi:MAG: DUF2232 domain-containing protein [Thermodesulfobacteriota bacterium]
MSENQTPPPHRETVAILLREPSLLLGAGLGAGLFLTVDLIPVMGLVFGSFTPVPFIYYYRRRGRTFGLTMIFLATLSVTLIHLVGGNPLGGLVFLEYAVLAGIMGEGLCRRYSAGKLLGLTTAAVLLLALSLLFITSLGQGRSAWSYGREAVTRQIKESFRAYQGLLSIPTAPVSGLDRKSPGEGDRGEAGPRPHPDQNPAPDQEINRLVQALVSIFPGLLVMGTLLVAWANFMVGRSLLAKTDDLPIELADLKTWRTPEQLVWALIICGFGAFLGAGWIKTLSLNCLLVLGLVYFFHGLAIVAFWLDKKAAPLFIRVLVYAVIGLQQYLALAIAALGLFDLWTDFRKLKAAGGNHET